MASIMPYYHDLAITHGRGNQADIIGSLPFPSTSLFPHKPPILPNSFHQSVFQTLHVNPDFRCKEA